MNGSRPNVAGLTATIATSLSTHLGRPYSIGLIDYAMPPGDDGYWGFVAYLPGGEPFGTMANPQYAKNSFIQVTTFGLSHTQAEKGADLVAEAILGMNPDGSWVMAIDPPAGYAISNRFYKGDGGVDTSAERTRPIFWKPERFELLISPA